MKILDPDSQHLHLISMYNKDKQGDFLSNYLEDMVQRSDSGCYAQATDFLTLAQQEDLKPVIRHLNSLYPDLSIRFNGGYEGAERKLIEVIPNIYGACDDEQAPICILKAIIPPVNRKFMTQTLTHRDYLGSILGLGIERELIGDLLIFEDEKEAGCMIICAERISAFIKNELRMVRHTSIEILDEMLPKDFHYKQQYEEIHAAVNSERLDALIAAAFHHSRSSMTSLITSEKVHVNGHCVTNTSAILKENDIVSVRGYGKFLYCGITGKTRKDRLSASIKKYI